MPEELWVLGQRASTVVILLMGGGDYVGNGDIPPFGALDEEMVLLVGVDARRLDGLVQLSIVRCLRISSRYVRPCQITGIVWLHRGTLLNL